jgi:hypothetical protein
VEGKSSSWRFACLHGCIAEVVSVDIDTHIQGPDQVKVIMRLKHALVALYDSETKLGPNEPAGSKLRLEFRMQIERMRSKLREIAGADGLRAFDAECAAQRSVQGNGDGKGASPPAAPTVGPPAGMNTEQLAHELLLDPTFQLSESGSLHSEEESPIMKSIRASFEQVNISH